jgi:hypothetical protein
MRLPSKSLKDIKLDDNLYKADFDLSGRYDALATVLERLALLGIGAYGFFVSKAGMDNAGDPTQALLGFARHPSFPSLGLLAFALSAACALYCKYLNSRCLKLQLDILRLLGRGESARWQEASEQEVNADNLAELRAMQASMLRRGRDLIFVAVVSLIVGASATVISFVLALFLAHANDGAHCDRIWAT